MPEMSGEMESKALPSGTVTFLMTDIVRSTALWESDHKAMQSAVATHDAIILEAVKDRGGRLVKQRGEGDSHFAVFESTRDAVLAAADLQRRLKACFESAAEPLCVRTAINAGYIDCIAEDYYGPVVHRCARLRSAAHGGQVLLTEAAYALAKEVSEVSFKDLGAHSLKDISGHERIYQLLASGLEQEFPAVNSAGPVRNNLPSQLSSFIGRDAEIEVLSKLVTTYRLVNLVGSGGCGKTRLATELGATLPDTFTDGVWFVQLAALPVDTFIPQEIAAVIGIEEPGMQDTESLAVLLRNKRCLLILDNCEHLIAGVARLVSALLSKCQKLTILSTSREPLRLPGEQNYRVPSLSTGGDEELGIDQIRNLEAVKLFSDRSAERGLRDLLGNDGHCRAVLEICRKLDGIPLAIEQAASHLDIFSPQELLRELNKHFDVLKMDLPTVEPRHRTVRATIDWSYKLLDPAEKLLFARLSVFRGSFSLDAVRYVCGKGLATAELGAALQRLAQKSLVGIDHRVTHGRRFRMIASLREYASELTEDRPNLESRHFDWCMEVARTVENQFLDGDSEALDRLDPDQDNFRISLQLGLEARQGTTDPLQMCLSLHHYWLARAEFNEAQDWLTRALEEAPPTAHSERAAALNVLGVIYWYKGQLEIAETSIRSSLDYWRSVGKATRIGGCLNNLGMIAIQKLDVKTARDCLTEASTILTQAGDKRKASAALLNLAKLENDEGNPQRAQELYDEVLGAIKALNDHWGLSSLYADLAESATGKKDFTLARNLWKQSLEAWQKHKDEILAAGFLVGIAWLFAEEGDKSAASLLIAAAESAYERHGATMPRDIQNISERVAKAVAQFVNSESFGDNQRRGRKLKIGDAVGAALELLERAAEPLRV